jgi:hypothetical protein
LPKVENPGYKITETIHLFGKNEQLNSAALFVALGDLQCSFYGCAENPNDCGNFFLLSFLCLFYS